MIIQPLMYLDDTSFKDKDNKDISCSIFVHENTLDVYYSKSFSNVGLEKGKVYKCLLELNGKKWKVKDVYK